MRKAEYNITLFAGKDEKKAVKISGYVFNYSGLRFGITNKLQDGGKSYQWTVTELTTGMNTGFYYTDTSREKTMKNITADAENMLPKIKKIVAAYLEKNADVNPDIAPDTDLYGLGRETR